MTAAQGTRLCTGSAVADPRGGAPWCVPPPQRLQDTKKYLQIYEDLDGGFVGDNQVLLLFYHLSSIFTHIS